MSDLPRDLDGGRYRLVELIGRGGYGEVYRGVQTSVDRTVAIKLTHPHLEAREDVAERFRREARLCSRLDHRNAVRVIDFGESEGSLFLVMDYVRGRTLKAVLGGDGPLSAARVRTVLRGVADALAAAHDIGLVHRDLKPANVLVADDDTPVVIDFGLVKVFSGEDDGATVTRSNVMIGTPTYLSPEAVVGQAVDGRSDLFSLGVVAYELLSGRRPFSGRTALEVATARLHDTPAPLPDRVPEDLRRLVRWLLALDPEARPQCASDVVAYLDRPRPIPPPPTDATVAPTRGPAQPAIAGGEPKVDVTARPVVAVDAPTRMSARRRSVGGVRTAAITAVTLAVVAAAAWSFGSRRVREADATPHVETPTAETEATGRGDRPAGAKPGSITVQPRALAEIELEAGAAVEPDTVAGPLGDSTTEGAATPTTTPDGADRRDGADSLPVDLPTTSAEAASPSAAAAPLEPTVDGRAVEPEDPERDAAARARRERTSPTNPATGVLTVNIEPWGEVWVDGERQGDAPVRGLDLPAGEHLVETRYLDATREERVVVERDEHTTVTHRFRR